MALSTSEALKAVAGVTPEFKAAEDALLSVSQANAAEAAPRHITDVPYSHGEATLMQAIVDAAPGRIAYDDFSKHFCSPRSVFWVTPSEKLSPFCS